MMFLYEGLTGRVAIAEKEGKAIMRHKEMEKSNRCKIKVNFIVRQNAKN